MAKLVYCGMSPKAKFLIGAGFVVVTVGFLMAEGIRDTGVYFLLPSELAERAAQDSSIYDVGIRLGGTVVNGSIHRDVAAQILSFEVTDGNATFPVLYRGLAPDTFADDVEVVVEGRLSPGGTVQATNVLAKCGSRYEAVPDSTVESTT